MKVFPLPLAGLALLVLLSGCQKPVKVLLVAGGHSFDTLEFFELFHSLEGIDMDSAYYPDAMEMMRSGLADAYDVLVFYDYMPNLPEADSSVFQKLTAEGKSLLFLHHALCSFQQWEGYKELLGGKYVMAAPGLDSNLVSDYKHDIDMEVEVLDNQHPVTQGLEDFTIHDEGYSNISLTQDITPLLRTNHPDCSPLVGWTKESGRSSIVYLMLGHDRQAYENPAFKQLLEQSIRWLADQ
ncbi:MAG: ThuA domain-containing protein [Bacteroides sp.]|nr:ThuA domain-containing protein [Bacteroides sp.]